MPNQTQKNAQGAFKQLTLGSSFENFRLSLTLLYFHSPHPSPLLREGPWSCGNSKPPSQAPNPRERAPPPRLTYPAR